MNTQYIISAIMIAATAGPLMAQSATPVQQESTLQTILNAGKDYSDHRAREKRIERRDERRDRERHRDHRRHDRHHPQRHR